MERNSAKVKVISIGIPEYVLKVAKRAASDKGVSFSKFVTDLLCSHLNINKYESMKKELGEEDSRDMDSFMKELKKLYEAVVRGAQSDIPKWKAQLMYREMFEKALERFNLTRKELVDILENM